MSCFHLLWIVPLSWALGFLVGIFQGDHVQLGGSGNSMSINGVERGKNGKR